MAFSNCMVTFKRWLVGSTENARTRKKLLCLFDQIAWLVSSGSRVPLVARQWPGRERGCSERGVHLPLQGSYEEGRGTE